MSRMAEIINRALMTKNMKVVTPVYETNDYSVFKELEHNRDVKLSRVKKLVASFSEKEILNPIVVNENMEIVDGQGRYEALKTLGRPIKFIVSYGANIEDCRRMNAYNTNWGMMDFVKSFARSGNLNYANLLECQQECRLSFNTILWVCQISSHIYHNSKTPEEWTTNTIASGKLVFTEENKKQAKLFSIMAQEIIDALTLKTKAGLDSFYRGITIVFRTDGYDHQRMVKNAKKCRSSFYVMSALEDMLTEFSRVYNTSARASNKIYFQDYMRNKGANKRDYTDQYINGYAETNNAKTLVARSKL